MLTGEFTPLLAAGFARVESIESLEMDAVGAKDLTGGTAGTLAPLFASGLAGPSDELEKTPMSSAAATSVCLLVSDWVRVVLGLDGCCFCFCTGSGVFFGNSGCGCRGGGIDELKMEVLEELLLPFFAADDEKTRGRSYCRR